MGWRWCRRDGSCWHWGRGVRLPRDVEPGVSRQPERRLERRDLLCPEDPVHLGRRPALGDGPCRRFRAARRTRVAGPAAAGGTRWRRPSTAALVCLAQEAWIDGCLGEGAAAGAAAAAVAEAHAPEARATQEIIARDEGRHAELAWDVLAWCWQPRTPEVRDALGAAADEPPAAAARQSETDDDLCARHGRLTDRRRAQVTDDERSRARDRL